MAPGPRPQAPEQVPAGPRWLRWLAGFPRASDRARPAALSGALGIASWAAPRTSERHPRDVRKLSLTLPRKWPDNGAGDSEVPLWQRRTPGLLHPPGGCVCSLSHRQLWRERHRMRVDHSRLLILLVLVSVVAAANWSTVFAGRATGPPSVAAWPRAVSAPGAVPTSGEPDVGQTPHPVTHAGVNTPRPHENGPQAERRPAFSWLDWVLRNWESTYLGMR